MAGTPAFGINLKFDDGDFRFINQASAFNEKLGDNAGRDGACHQANAMKTSSQHNSGTLPLHATGRS